MTSPKETLQKFNNNKEIEKQILKSRELLLIRNFKRKENKSEKETMCCIVDTSQIQYT